MSLGAVGADVVTDAFYNFAPPMVERAIPDAWSFATPESLVRARSWAAMAALREVCPTVDEVAPAVVGMLRDVVTSAADDPTRPLYRANREVARPDDPVAEVWQHCTTIREHRGDGHVTALRRARLDGCEAHVLAAAEAGVPTELLRTSRGWTEDEWAAATDRLRERGLVDRDGGATDAGRDLARPGRARHRRRGPRALSWRRRPMPSTGLSTRPSSHSPATWPRAGSSRTRTPSAFPPWRADLVVRHGRHADSTMARPGSSSGPSPP